MSRAVLDASALLAILNDEPGAENLSPTLLADAAVSAVNLAEVHSKLVKAGIHPEDAWRATLSPVGEVVPFTADHAKVAGSLSLETKTLGLSLGDRACLALALSLKVPVYTCDRVWKKLRLGVPVHLIR